jgi:hypothetical protein
MLARTQSLAILQCHQDTPCTAVKTIKAALGYKHGRVLTITYVLDGIIDRLRIPPYRSAHRVDGLWRHTCFETFIGAKNDAEYYEFNFSPSGEWAAYGFRDYRESEAIDADGLEPKIDVQCNAEILELTAAIHLDRLPGFGPAVCLSLGLSAVIEDLGGSLSYWALKHPPGKPDFHHPDVFTLEIGAAG